MSPTTPDAHLLPTATLSGGDIILTINKSGLVGVDYSIEGSSTLLSESWNQSGLTVITDNATTLQVNYPISVPHSNTSSASS